MRFLIEAANAAVGVEDGLVVAASGRFDHTIQVRGGEVRPGLINAHDHLHRNHYGRLGCPPYANAYAWADDIQKRHADEIRRGRARPRRAALLVGAWKNLFSGVTHVVHHDPWEPDFDDGFPLEVVRIACADSLGHAPDLERPESAPFALHVAEGVDQAAADEVRLLATRGILSPDLIAVHAVGPDDQGVAALRASGAALAWCPTSNQFLFGRTAPAALLADGMDVLLGSDSLLTGEGTLLDEIHAARGKISDARLLGAVGPTAARRLGIDAPRTAIGARADLVLLRRAVLEATLDDVLLVMAQGELRVLHPDLAATLGVTAGSMVDWRGVRRWIGGENPFRASSLVSGAGTGDSKKPSA
jgi:cytosine/adenosine deaminase-related metal-dependent hydrolase